MGYCTKYTEPAFQELYAASKERWYLKLQTEGKSTWNVTCLKNQKREIYISILKKRKLHAAMKGADNYV